MEERETNELIQIRKDKLAELQQSQEDPFANTRYDLTHHSQEVIDHFEELEGQVVAVAGRMMTKRVMGKASFCHIQDEQGQIQLYVRKNDVGEELYDAFKRYDLGDIIGVKGEVFKTKRGEISIKAKEMILLAKSLQILPEKYHGLKDTDLRYRQRYVDLIVNPEVKDTFIKRTKIIQAIRRFLDNQSFLEVETPVLHT
ncbi:MAG: lysine--tRNA ligase, partial [Epulopiscium sp.]|nr:lysine--tRNA ligase [Candidatus Epulonipiscium sp.]